VFRWRHPSNPACEQVLGSLLFVKTGLSTAGALVLTGRATPLPNLFRGTSGIVRQETLPQTTMLSTTLRNNYSRQRLLVLA
jgi:hypothetical protein